MAITTAQLVLAKAEIFDRLVLRYEPVRNPAIRIAVQLVKNGTLIQQEAAKAILRQAYQAIHGVDPVGVHQFKHWVHVALRNDPEDATTGVADTDAFEATAIVVT